MSSPNPRGTTPDARVVAGLARSASIGGAGTNRAPPRASVRSDRCPRRRARARSRARGAPTRADQSRGFVQTVQSFHSKWRRRLGARSSRANHAPGVRRATRVTSATPRSDCVRRRVVPKGDPPIAGCRSEPTDSARRAGGQYGDALPLHLRIASANAVCTRCASSLSKKPMPSSATPLLSMVR